jgi:glutathione-regulated potassium-efflux system protein KefB
MRRRNNCLALSPTNHRRRLHCAPHSKDGLTMVQESHSVLNSAVIFLAAAVIAVPLTKRLKLGAVLGYLLAGLLVGPYGLRLVSDPQTVLALSELGVVLLLFVLGLELSPQRLWIMRKLVFAAGGLQVGLTTLALAALGHYALNLSWPTAWIAGFGLSLSSTAFALQMLAERGEMQSPQGRSSFGILLFQDLLAVPVLALLPMVVPHAVSDVDGSWWLGAARVLGAIILVVVAGRYLLRPLLRLLALSKSVEVFTAAALLLVLSTALLMQKVGLSMGLGAFLAGVLLADSEYQHELESHIDPFKGLLLGLFFMAVGMGLDLRLLLKVPILIAAMLLALLAIKLAIGWMVGRVSKLSTTTSMLLGSLLAAGGEFAFVVFRSARELNAMSPEWESRLNLVVALSMALTPLLVMAASHLAKRASEQANERPFDDMPGDDVKVVIAGFGRVGQIIGRVLRAQKIPFTAIDPDTEAVDFMNRFGNFKVYYGDPSRPEILRATKVENAELFVLALDDPEMSVRIARLVHRQYPKVKIIARARNRQHAFKLMELGLDTPVRETLHSSLQMTHKVLEELGFSSEMAADRVYRFRMHDEELLQQQYLVHDNESALRQSAKQAIAELSDLFAADTK